MPERHEMVRVGRAPSGAEEWSCPKCGHRLLLRWPPPRFEVTVLTEGDTSAEHTGTKCAPAQPEQGTGAVMQGAGTVSEDELRWLNSLGIDWNGQPT